MTNKKTGTVVLEWFTTLVLVINVAQLTAISIRYKIDHETFSREWTDSASGLGKHIPFEIVFHVWIGLIITGLKHNVLFAIGEALDSDCLMIGSIVLGALKEFVSNFTLVKRLML